MPHSELQPRLSASRKLDSLESSSMDASPSCGSNAGAMSLSTDSGGCAAVRAFSGAVARRMTGFNLVELLVTITIASILMGIGVPSYRYVTNSNRVASEVNALLGDMMIARSEAIKEGQTVTVCPSNDGATCDANATDWSEGWIVFTDFNSNGTVDTDTANNDSIVRYQRGFGSGDSFVMKNGTNKWVSFNRDGFALALTNSGTTHLLHTLHTNPVNDQWTRCLEITLAGMMTTEHKGTGICQ
jgi:type IV fimbrial biogenesis protein FimT